MYMSSQIKNFSLEISIALSWVLKRKYPGEWLDVEPRGFFYLKDRIF